MTVIVSVPLAGWRDASTGAERVSTQSQTSIEGQASHYVFSIHGQTKPKHHLVVDLPQILDAAYAHLAYVFGYQVKGTMRVEIFHNREAMAAAMPKRDKLPEGVGVAGGYAIQDDIVYVLYDNQTSDELIEALVHELAHQYQYHTIRERGLLPEGSRIDSKAYVEGVAQIASDVVWVDQGNRCSRLIPTIRGHWPAEALHALEVRFPNQIGSLATKSDGLVDYSVARALVAFLQLQHPELYRVWSARLDRGLPAAEAWNGSLHDFNLMDAELRAQLASYLRDEIARLEREQGYTYATARWQRDADGTWQGNTGLDTQAVMIPTSQLMPMEHRFTENWGVITGPGYVFNYKDPENFELVRVLRGGEVQHEAVRDGRWPDRPRQVGRLNHFDWRSDWRFGLAVNQDKYVFSVAGRDAAHFKREPDTKVGLAVFGGCGMFSELKQTTRPTTERKAG